MTTGVRPTPQARIFDHSAPPTEPEDEHSRREALDHRIGLSGLAGAASLRTRNLRAAEILHQKQGSGGCGANTPLAKTLYAGTTSTATIQTDTQQTTGEAGDRTVLPASFCGPVRHRRGRCSASRTQVCSPGAPPREMLGQTALNTLMCPRAWSRGARGPGSSRRTGGPRTGTQ
jgi:hypothetical protein